ncbi:hypothetical protein FNW02_17660 [Komarekiella sp. 'clone 1']|uniref:Uncharacterized protein n=1 Tax=Komarekiella delphini-convector SJRDD-AB1 TaxID=2593771 RepID=A0AA40SZ27_9NOST|nr:hypothetical protein [Komarekiella delphini-convector SJRDD-AB1]MBE9033727.1 hypothetical protein [aff. Roholtiella sp. LEGE 12411]
MVRLNSSINSSSSSRA